VFVIPVILGFFLKSTILIPVLNTPFIVVFCSGHYAIVGTGTDEIHHLDIS
jgi:hypothetical protein